MRIERGGVHRTQAGDEPRERRRKRPSRVDAVEQHEQHVAPGGVARIAERGDDRHRMTLIQLDGLARRHRRVEVREHALLGIGERGHEAQIAADGTARARELQKTRGARREHGGALGHAQAGNGREIE